MQGKILRVKQGYNPNSSSMGSIIFALPVSMIAVSFGMAAISGLIFPHFIKEKRREKQRHKEDRSLPVGTSESERSTP